MVWRIARKELLERWRDPWLTIAALAMVVLGVMAGSLGARAVALRAASAGTAGDAEYARWLAQPPRDPHSASHFGLSVFYVPSRLAALDPGVNAYAGGSLFLEAHRQNEPFSAEGRDGGALQRLAALHLGTLLQLWLPLIVIVAAAGAFAAEREQGTLAQLLSLGVSPRTLAVGKILAVAGSVIVVALPGVAAALVTAWLDGAGAPWPDDTALRLTLFLIGYALYVGFWIVLAVVVSGVARSSRLAAAVLAACWCVATVVIPRLGLDVARLRHPLPSLAELERVDLERRMSTPEEYARHKQAILAEYGVKTAGELPIDFNVIYAQRAEQRVNGYIDERLARMNAIFLAERRDYLRAAWLSPAVAIDLLSMAASGSDDVHYRAFLQQAEAYRRQMMDVLGRAQIRKPGGPAPRGDAALWEQLPPFRFTVPSLGVDAVTMRRASLVLALWFAGTGVLGALLLRRVAAR